MTTEHAVSAHPDGGYFEVLSGRSRKVYRVTPTASGSATCECYWWIKTHEACSHIRSVRKFAANVLKDGEAIQSLAPVHPVDADACKVLLDVPCSARLSVRPAGFPAAVLPSLPPIDPIEILSQADREIAEYRFGCRLQSALEAWVLKAEGEPRA